MKLIRFFLFFSFLLVGIWSCSSTAKKKSAEYPKGFKKAWHDLNARFNGYFNANLLVQGSITNLSEGYQDNYNQILALYRESAVDDAKSQASDLDEAIKKSAIVISLHRGSKWADDAYLLIGKSEYLKKEYDLAVETFDYIVQEYDPKYQEEKQAKVQAKTKKKKKKRRKKKKRKKKKKVTSASSSRRNFVTEQENEATSPDRYFMKHRPIRDDARVWLARSLVEVKRYDEALFVIRQLQNDQSLIPKLKAETAIVESYVYLKQKAYSQAINPLKRGIELTSGKKQKTRYAYILAQLYQLNGQTAEAAAAYDRVLKLKPEYDMEFRTRLNKIVNSWESKQIDTPTASNKLDRMVKDFKNEEFRDQIYYVLGTIYLEEQSYPVAIDNFKSSLKYNTNNTGQKTESYLALARIYFDSEKYVLSKRYYDSTLLVMSNKDDRHPEVKNYSETLTDIAKQIEIIELQDSLLMVARMDPEEKAKLAKKLKKDFLEREEKNKKPKLIANKGLNTLPGITDRSPGGLASGGRSDFWAYDASSVKKGKKDFTKIWGERQLEDDWRRSNRRNINLAVNEEVEDPTENIYVTETEMKQIFSSVPETPEEFEAINGKIIDAMFLLGNLYRDRLQNEALAIKTLEELNRRFPGNKHELDALYTLYVMYLTTNPTKANQVKQEILSKYPKSRQATVLGNPNDANALQVADQKLDQYYSDAYNKYETEDFQTALAMAEKADELFGNKNQFRPKFALLTAMCVGHVDGREAYVKALNDVIKGFPNTDEERKAKEILRYLGGAAVANNPALIGNDVAAEDQKNLFVHAPNDPHYILVVMSGKSVKVSEAKRAVSDYHRQYHNLDNLKISSLLIDMNTPILIVRRFGQDKAAFDYFEGVNNRPVEFLGSVDPGFKLFPISQSNYKTLLRIRKNTTLHPLLRRKLPIGTSAFRQIDFNSWRLPFGMAPFLLSTTGMLITALPFVGISSHNLIST